MQRPRRVGFSRTAARAAPQSFVRIAPRISPCIYERRTDRAGFVPARSANGAQGALRVTQAAFGLPREDVLKGGDRPRDVIVGVDRRQEEHLEL